MSEKCYGDSLASRQPPTSECDHDRNACDECLTALVTAALQGSNLAALVCPDPECRKPIQGEEVRRLVPDLHRRQELGSSP